MTAVGVCQFCGADTKQSRYDASFRVGGEERNYFALPGAICVPCRQLYLDAQLITMMGLRDGQCTFAIESDTVLRRGF